MRIRRILTGSALGAVLAMSAITVPAHAVQPQLAAQSANIPTSAKGPAKPSGYEYSDWFFSFSSCEAARRANPGPASHPSYCLPAGALYYLWVWR